MEHQYLRAFILCERDRNILGDTLGRRSRQAGIFLKLLLCYMRTLQEIVGRRSRQARILIGALISPYFRICVRDRNALGDTVGRHRQQVRIFIETLLCYMSTLREISGRRSRQARTLV